MRVIVVIDGLLAEPKTYAPEASARAPFSQERHGTDEAAARWTDVPPAAQSAECTCPEFCERDHEYD